MKLTSSVIVNLRTKAVQAKVTEASRLGLRDTIVDITADAVKGSPTLTGNNRRSLTQEVSGMGDNTMVDPDKIEGAVFSTSGYGGFLETGTYKMAARPYIRPALDRNKRKLAPNIKKHMEQT